MTPKEALQYLDVATMPAMMGKLNRVDYANIQQALECLQKVVDDIPKLAEKEKPKEEPKP